MILHIIILYGLHIEIISSVVAAAWSKTTASAQVLLEVMSLSDNKQHHKILEKFMGRPSMLVSQNYEVMIY